MKYPVIKQEEDYSCGAYCIKMLLEYYHIHEDIKEIKKQCGLTTKGVSVRGMMECLKYYHIEAKAYKGDITKMEWNFEYPYILLVKEEGLAHYVLLYGKKDNLYICGNPSGELCFYTLGELHNKFLGTLIDITFVSNIVPSKTISFKKYIYDLICMHKKDVYMLIFYSSMLSFNSLFMQSMMKLYLDKQNYLYFMSFLLICFIRIYFSVISSSKSKDVLIDLQKEIYYEYLLKLVKKDERFYLMYRKEDVLYRMNLIKELAPYILDLFEKGLKDLLIVVGGILLIVGLRPILGLVILFECILLGGLYFYQYKMLEKLDHKELLDYNQLYRMIQNSIYDSYMLSIYQPGIYKDYYEYMQSFDKKNSFLIVMQANMNGIFIVMTITTLCLQRAFNLNLSDILYVFMLLSLIQSSLMQILNMILMYPRMNTIYEYARTFELDHKEVVIEKKVDKIVLDMFTYRYGKAKALFDKCSEVFDGHYLVKGDNGCGKSTFLKVIAGFYDDYDGSVLYNNQELNMISLDSIHQHVLYLTSKGSLMFDYVYELFEEEVFVSLLMKLNLLSYMYLYTYAKSQLSYGQNQLIHFLYTLISDYDVYIYDEAFSYLDESTHKCIVDFLNSDFYKNKIVFFVSHQTKVMNSEYRYVIIGDGKIRIERNYEND